MSVFISYNLENDRHDMERVSTWRERTNGLARLGKLERDHTI